MIAKVIHSIAYFGVTGVYFTDPKGERPWQVWRLVIALVRVKAEEQKKKHCQRTGRCFLIHNLFNTWDAEVLRYILIQSRK